MPSPSPGTPLPLLHWLAQLPGPVHAVQHSLLQPLPPPLLLLPHYVGVPAETGSASHRAVGVHTAHDEQVMEELTCE